MIKIKVINFYITFSMKHFLLNYSFLFLTCSFKKLNTETNLDELIILIFALSASLK